MPVFNSVGTVRYSCIYCSARHSSKTVSSEGTELVTFFKNKINELKNRNYYLEDEKEVGISGCQGTTSCSYKGF